MKMKKLTAVALAGAMVVGMLGTGSILVKADGSTTDYVLTIPAKLTVENSGWNATAGITAKVESAVPQYADQLREASRYDGDFDDAGFWSFTMGKLKGNSITLNAHDGYQHSKDGTTWQESNVEESFGVRPVLQLNLTSVIFSSESKTFTIAPAGPTAKTGLVYTGSPLDLVTAPESGKFSIINHYIYLHKS